MFDEKCSICGVTCAEVGAMRFYKGKAYCDGSLNPRYPSCWKKNFQTDSNSLTRLPVRVNCVFCGSSKYFNPEENVSGKCEMCGAEFYEGDEEIVYFTKGLTELGIAEVKKGP
jgi:hypothetical protein